MSVSAVDPGFDDGERDASVAVGEQMFHDVRDAAAVLDIDARHPVVPFAVDENEGDPAFAERLDLAAVGFEPGDDETVDGRVGDGLEHRSAQRRGQQQRVSLPVADLADPLQKH